MAERSSRGPADKGPCTKCGQIVEATASGDVCTGCESQQTGEHFGTHPRTEPSVQGQAESRQRGNDQVTSGTAENETPQVVSVNAEEGNPAQGSGGASESAIESDVGENVPDNGLDLNGGAKQGSTAASTDSSSGIKETLPETSNSTKTVSCRIQWWSIHEQLCIRETYLL